MKKRERYGKVDYSRSDWPEQQREIVKRREAAIREKRIADQVKAGLIDEPDPDKLHTPTVGYHSIKFSRSHPLYRHFPDNRPKPYKMSAHEIRSLHMAQGERCANPGCREFIAPFGRTRAVDHNHETGQVRGLLCKLCNVGIGMFREDPKRIVGILVYLGCLDKKLIE